MIIFSILIVSLDKTAVKSWLDNREESVVKMANISNKETPIALVSSSHLGRQSEWVSD